MDQIRGTGPIKLPGTGPIQAPDLDPLAARVVKSTAHALEALSAVKPDSDADQTQKKTGPLSASQIDLEAIGKSVKVCAKALDDALEDALDLEDLANPARGIHGRQSGGGGDGALFDTSISASVRPSRRSS